MSLKDEVTAAAAKADLRELEALLSRDRRVVRHLVSLSFRPEEEFRRAAVHGLSVAAELYPDLAVETARRLIWAMNDESGAYGVTAPAILRGIAERAPELLVPLVPDLMRLSADPALHDTLVETAQIVGRSRPRDAVNKMEQSLRGCAKGEHSERKRPRQR